MTVRVAVLLAALVGGCQPPREEVVVFAAASLTDVAEAAAQRVTEQTSHPVVVSVGSTASLARQIERGAPADVFLAADPSWVERLRDRTDAVRDVEDLAHGRLVVIGPRGTPAASTVAAALGIDGRVAIGDPAHVPAGVYAHRALDALGEWERVEPRAVPQADVRAALAAVEAGAAHRGIVYASDAAISDRVAVVYTFPERVSGAITYQGALLRSERGRAVLDALTDATGQAEFERRGFRPRST